MQIHLFWNKNCKSAYSQEIPTDESSTKRYEQDYLSISHNIKKRKPERFLRWKKGRRPTGCYEQEVQNSCTLCPQIAWNLEANEDDVRQLKLNTIFKH